MAGISVRPLVASTAPAAASYTAVAVRSLRAKGPAIDDARLRKARAGLGATLTRQASLDRAFPALFPRSFRRGASTTTASAMAVSSNGRPSTGILATSIS